MLLSPLSICCLWIGLWSQVVLAQLEKDNPGPLNVTNVTGNPNTTSAEFGPLRFRDDGTFQISVFEDLHFGENAWDAWGPLQDIQTTRVMNAILDIETPDLIVLNGDLITGNNAFKANATAYMAAIAAPLVARNLTWASTYGNHDSDFNLSRVHLWHKEHEWPNSRTGNMVAGGDQVGVSNYYLPVYGAECDGRVDTEAMNGCVPELILWFFDSRGGNRYQQLDDEGNVVPEECWVDESVVEWFTQTRTELARSYSSSIDKATSTNTNTTTVIPSLAFVHIPLNASRALQLDSKGVDPNLFPGINDDFPLAGQGQGWCANGTVGCAYGGQDVPFMEALVATEGLMGVFSGHDHGDTWCYNWNTTGLSSDSSSALSTTPMTTPTTTSLNLCFGQHSGYGGYGSWIRGARQILISKIPHRQPLQQQPAQARRQQQPLDTDDDTVSTAVAAVPSSAAPSSLLTVDTWIRTEQQTIIGSISLNATYGQDIYPATPDVETFCLECNL
ncbi:Metallo-dependent phosphatase-like protein [Coniella lustricola]|uniref:Metallo-dependent phosphatase-like protein n=1 Tax=Coniella lustricola TaxID=2025994 RepID=A0A2T3AN06_9PEZI|nr:Metallo-dependent phosphatase-like protein [Coniella lustricola]